YAREDLDGDLVGAERLERLVQVDLMAVDDDAAPSERIGDVLGGDGSVELAAVADLDAKGQGRAGDPSGVDLRLLALALALLLAAGDIVLPGPVRTSGSWHGEL